MYDLVRQIIKQGYAHLAFPFSQHVPAVFEGWLKLVHEPVEYRRLWTFDVQGQDDPDDGLVDYIDNPINPKTGEKRDAKMYFHLRPWLRGLLQKRGVDFRRHEPWLDVCDLLYHASLENVHRLAEAMDKVIPGKNFRERMDAAKDQHTLRLLWYREPVVDITGEEVIAQLHTDRDLATLHLAENHPGLTVGGIVIPAQRDLAIVFPGKKAQLMTGGTLKKAHLRNSPIEGGFLKALPHSAVDTRGRTDHRVVAVFFAHTDIIIEDS